MFTHTNRFAKLFSILFLSLVPVGISAQNNFRSLAGGFEVSVPSGPNGQSGFTGGVRFVWSVNGASINIGAGDLRGLQKAVRDNQFSAEEYILKYYSQFAQRGGKVSAESIPIDGKPGNEFRYKTSREFFIARILKLGNRLYTLTANFPVDTADANVPVVVGIFDSFRLIPKNSVENEINLLVSKSTPVPFAGTSKRSKQSSDLADRNLKGKIKSVLSETARYTADQVLLGKEAVKFEEFDEDGFLTKEIEYDSFGMPFRIFAYGFLDGKRVARIGLVESETRLTGIAISMQGPIEDRFDEYYVYRYLGGKLAEVRNYRSNNALYSKERYRYGKNTRTLEYLDERSRPFSRIVEIIGENGNPTKFTEYGLDGNKLTPEDPFEVEYDQFDTDDNWTQRTIYRWYGPNDTGRRLAEYTEYRTIIYY